MTIKYKPLEAITEQDLLDLVTNEVGEGRDIEYKQELKYSDKQDKVKLLAAFASFANTNGGDIVFGIREDPNTNLPQEVCGIQIDSEDKLVRTLENIAQDGLEPRLPYIQIYRVPLPSKNSSALIVRIGRSFAGPHMIDFDKVCRFYGRNSKGKYIMDVRQIRAAFDLSGTLTDRTHSFRNERLTKIKAGDTPVSMPDGAKIVLHIVPFSAFETGANNIDVSVLRHQHIGLRWPITIGSGSSDRLNFDGHLTYGSVARESPYKTESYVQVFRIGIIEAVDSTILSVLGQGRQSNYISYTYEKSLVEALVRYSKLLNALSVTPPFFLMLSLVDVKNYLLSGGSERISEPIDRQDLILPEVMVENYFQNDEDVASALQPIFDTVWNAGGKTSSPNFDKDGNWKPQN